MEITKKSIIICLLCAIALTFPAAALAKDDNDALMLERAAVCYVEGERFDGLILGSKGSIQFVYLDVKLSKALNKAHADLAGAKTARFPFPEWLEEYNQYFAKAGKDKVVFIAELETFKPWDVEPAEIFIGGYHLTKNDILSPSMTNPFGEVPSETVAYFAFTVPKSEIKPGTEISIGYGEYGVKWKIPK